MLNLVALLLIGQTANAPLHQNLPIITNTTHGTIDTTLLGVVILYRWNDSATGETGISRVPMTFVNGQWTVESTEQKKLQSDITTSQKRRAELQAEIKYREQLIKDLKESNDEFARNAKARQRERQRKREQGLLPSR